MKLLLLHGAGIASSRQKLTQLKAEFDPSNVIVFGEGTEISDIKDNLLSVSLFPDDRLVILENPSKDFILDSEILTANSQVILWFETEIDTKNYPNASVFYFPENKEVSIFPFLDSMGNKDKRAFLELEKLKKDYDTQYLITMIFYLLRSLVTTPKGAKDFVKRKNERMRANFQEEELISLYKSVLEIDFKIKSGLMEIQQAQFSLVNLFT